MDNSKTLQSYLDDFASGRGGILTLDPQKYVLDTPLRIYGKSTCINGGANGFSNSPNAEHESLTGSELHSTGDALHIGNHNPEYIRQGMNKLGAINLQDLYLWGPGTDSQTHAIKIDNDIDQSQFNNIHIGNYTWGLYSEAVMDAPTINGLDVIHCQTGVEINALSVYVRFHACVLCDNDGIGLIVQPESGSFGWVISDCIIVRNSRIATDDGCNILWGGNNSSIVNNVIQDAGHHFYNEAVLGQTDVYVTADGLILPGNNNIISHNQFQDHTKGSAVVIRGNGNQIINNSFSNNHTDIFVDSNATDTVITQQTPFTIKDYGVRTIVNGISRNEGDPDKNGLWSKAVKPEGLILYDIVSGLVYQYSSYFSGGRICLK
jgi:hypothetical protein